MHLQTTDYSRASHYVESSRMAVDAGRIKMDIKSETETGLNHSLVFRGGESSSITVIDHRTRSFSVIDHETVAVLGTEMRLAMQNTALRVESLPPEQREVVQKMLEAQLGKARSKRQRAAGTVIKTSDRESVNGLSCVKHEVFQGGVKHREVFVAASDDLPGGEPALAALREMSDFYGTLMDALEEMTSGVGGFSLDQHPFEDLRRMDGFPALTRNFAGGRIKTEIMLLSVEEQQLSPAEFEPPEGYVSTIDASRAKKQ